jgi:hypothetical protein
MGRAVTPLTGMPPSPCVLGEVRGLALAVAVHLAACAGSAERSPLSLPGDANESAPPTAPRGAGPRLICQALGPRERTRELSARGRAQLEASRDGEHFASDRFEPAMALLREAAQGGERLAQSVYGKTRFATLFQLEAPRPEQREAYVEALAFWRTAALAEPEQDDSGITAATPRRVDFPLAELPAPWLREAWARADAWIRCHGLPW